MTVTADHPPHHAAGGDGPRRRAPRPWQHAARWITPRFLLAAMVAALAIEGGLRLVEAVNGRHGDTRQVFDEHAERLAAGAAPDVLVLGSSSAGSHVWAPTLEGRDLACDAYAAWLASPTMRDVTAFASRHVLPAVTTELVLVGVTMREFNSASPTLENPELDGWLDERHGDRSLWDRAQQEVALLRSRSILQDPYRFGETVLDRLRPQTDADGHHLPSLDQVIADESAEHRQQEIDEMADWTLSDEDLDALRTLLADLDARGLTTVVVDLPVSELFVEMAPGGAADQATYRAAVERVARDAGVRFVEGDGAPLDEPQHFADVNHLNREGSMIYTDHLVEELVDLGVWAEDRRVTGCGPSAAG